MAKKFATMIAGDCSFMKIYLVISLLWAQVPVAEIFQGTNSDGHKIAEALDGPNSESNFKKYTGLVLARVRSVAATAEGSGKKLLARNYRRLEKDILFLSSHYRGLPCDDETMAKLSRHTSSAIKILSNHNQDVDNALVLTYIKFLLGHFTQELSGIKN
jgi:hypothetical protein